ncbi:MAG: DUF5985 family protein [Terriglobales bacterium]
MKLDSFLVGVVVMASLTASVFFLKFYTRTRDSLFMAFALAFAIEAVNRVVSLSIAGSHDGSPWTYIVRLCAFLIILGAIVRKNYWTRG